GLAALLAAQGDGVIDHLDAAVAVVLEGNDADAAVGLVAVQAAAGLARGGRRGRRGRGGLPGGPLAVGVDPLEVEVAALGSQADVGVAAGLGVGRLGALLGAAAGQPLAGAAVQLLADLDLVAVVLDVEAEVEDLGRLVVLGRGRRRL